ncbi:MAG: DEAD/DEAH box helicase [Anaerolineaceae bacterium]|nr:DEAD/DEAH box helicase [Anaerolineaceae bacterium]
MLKNILSSWSSDPDFLKNCYWQVEQEYSGCFDDFPPGLASPVKTTLQKMGIRSLYAHQIKCWEAVKAGNNVAISTTTASGKSLCYNLPVLDSMSRDPNSRALYIFPTKALAQDQQQNLNRALSLATQSSEFSFRSSDHLIGVYDGDTPQSKRPEIRTKARLLFTNPDMLHTAILPHHTLWAEFFQHLRYVVLDEVHSYRGVFGSHVANVIRRLKRISGFYGAHPQKILTSATIANPNELSSRLIGEEVTLISQSGSPRGKKNFILYNPPLLNEELGIRASAVSESIRLASELLARNIQLIFFTRSRRSVEMTLRRMASNHSLNPEDTRGYRSGYTPRVRRQIENGLKNGEVKAVIATNALELGVDIGGIDAVIMAGYPGTIAAARQQAGRAGRRFEEGLAILVASNSPLDQYLFQNPAFLFENPPEKALINPDNLLVLLHHLRCAAFELPFDENSLYGSVSPEMLNDLLAILAQEGILYLSGGKYYWMADQYPANKISLRTATSDSVSLVVQHEDGNKIIGQVDATSAHWMVHPGAVYLHEWDTYLVKTLDLETNTATLKASNLDYYTEPRLQNTIECINVIKDSQVTGGTNNFGEVLVTTQLIGYKQIQWSTNIVLNNTDLLLPPTNLRTTAFWLTLNQDTTNHLLNLGVWRSAPNNYGNLWPRIRDQIRKRDHYQCQVCGEFEEQRPFHVHHKIPFKLFARQELANQPDNLITLCPKCHRAAELSVRVRSGLAGLSHLLRHLAPIFLMCDVSDLGAHMEYNCPFANHQPTVIIYEQVPAGIGLCREIFNNYEILVASALQRVKECACMDGCPACVGPAGADGLGAKEETTVILDVLAKTQQD